MKTYKMNALKSLFKLSLVALMLTACAGSGQESKNTAAIDKPGVDLQTAVLSGNLEAVKQHIAAGTDLNEKEPFGGSTPIVTASTFGKTKIAEALIDAGADLSIKNNDGSTALHAAAFFCHVEIVQALIDADVDKTVRNNFGSTARESVMGPFEEIKPVYELMQQQLGSLGLQLDMAEVEKTRPVIAMMLQ